MKIRGSCLFTVWNLPTGTIPMPFGSFPNVSDWYCRRIRVVSMDTRRAPCDWPIGTIPDHLPVAARILYRPRHLRWIILAGAVVAWVPLRADMCPCRQRSARVPIAAYPKRSPAKISMPWQHRWFRSGTTTAANTGSGS